MGGFIIGGKFAIMGEKKSPGAGGFLCNKKDIAWLLYLIVYYINNTNLIKQD